MIAIKIDVTKIDKSRLYPGEKGLYLNVTCFDKPTEYGEDGYITMAKTPEEMADKEFRLPIIGNWKYLKPKAKAPKEVNQENIPW